MNLLQQVLWVLLYSFVLFLEIAIHSLVQGTFINIPLCGDQFWVQNTKMNRYLALPSADSQSTGRGIYVTATINTKVYPVVGGCIQRV